MIDHSKIDKLRTVIGSLRSVIDRLRSKIDDWHARTVADKMNVIVVIALIALGLLFVAVVALLMV